MLDLAVSFTASRNIGLVGEGVIVNVLTTGVPLCCQYITGAARGGDAFTGRWLARHRPEAEHIVIVPYDKSQVDPWWLTTGGNITVVPMPPGTTYKDRNRELVQRGDAVCAFPAYPEDHPASARSGSWQAARMARRLGKLCRWDCVRPPYHGRIEKPLGEFLAEVQDA